MGQQLSFIWPALGQRPSGLARQRLAGLSAADGTCRAPASPELLAWPRGRITPGAGLILTGSRFALGSADVPPARNSLAGQLGPEVNGYRLHVVFGTGQVDHALASWPGRARRCRRCRGAGHLGWRAPDATDPGLFRWHREGRRLSPPAAHLQSCSGYRRWPGHGGNARARRPCRGSRCAGGAPGRRWVRGQSVPLSRLAHRHDGPGVGFPPMKDSPPTQLAVGEPKTPPRGQILPSTRYRHPGDVIRLIAAALVLAVAAVIAALFPALLRPAAAAITAVGPATAAGQVLTGLVQVAIAAAALVLLVAALRYRRFRVLVTVAGGFAAAAALMAGITYLAGPGGSAALPAGLRQGSWLTGAGFPDPAVLAGLAAVAVAAAPWLSRPWRRASWAPLLLIGAARLITGGLLPLQLVLALAAGVTVGAGLLVVFGVPDRRMGPAGVAAALRAGGVPVSQVTGPLRAAKGSRPFEATTGDGNGLFVKVFGSDQRDADLLYRAWRGIRLRGVGDTRPAASLFKAVEHEALLGVMAERAGVAVPHVGQVIKAEDGSVLLTMDLVAGTSLDEVPADRITDQLARTLWREVGRLHRARIAHRSLHGSNIMIGQNGCPRLVDFSFAELAATSRQRAIDVAELLTSLAGRIGPERAVATAAAAIGASGVATAVPLLQPLA